MKRMLSSLFALFFFVVLLLPNIANAQTVAVENWETQFSPNTDLVEKSLMAQKGLSVVVKRVQFSHDTQLKLYIEIYNTNKREYLLDMSYVLINGWAMEPQYDLTQGKQFFMDQSGAYGARMRVPGMSKTPAYISVELPYVVRYDEMQILELVDFTVCIKVYQSDRLQFQIKKTIENPDVSSSYCQAYFDDGKELHNDNRFRVIFQGKDTETGISGYYIENKRSVDDAPLIYETLLGNTVTDHIESARGKEMPSTFFLPANSKRLLFGPDIAAYCDASGLEIPTVTEIGLLFTKADPITANVGVPNGTNTSDWDFRTVNGSIVYQDQFARIFYTGVYEASNGQQKLMFVFENLNPIYAYCIQADNGAGRLDDLPVFIDFDNNVAAPATKVLATAVVSFADARSLDLHDYTSLWFDVIPQKRMDSEWKGIGGRLQLSIWEDCADTDADASSCFTQEYACIEP